MKDDLTPERLERARTLFRNGRLPKEYDHVRTLKPFAALQYENDDGDFVIGPDGTELTVPMPIGTLCEVYWVMWIGGTQGVAFHICPIGDQYPDPVPLQIDEADLVDGFYPIVTED